MRVLLALIATLACLPCSAEVAPSQAAEGASETAAPSRVSVAPVGEMHGACVMHLTSWEGSYDAAAYAELLGHLKKQGANTVALSAHAWQDRLDSTSLRPWDGKAEGRAALIKAIDASRAAGFRVFLKPHVEIGRDGERSAGAWRGNIRFDSAKPAREWFASYGAFILDLAGIAREHDVEVLAVGLELGGLTAVWRDDWLALIRAVRARYDGKLTYCANWWGEFETFQLWADLDFLGVQAFGPLAATADADQDQLRRGALAQVAGWRRVAREWRRPLLVTELGFKSSRAPWIEPWQWEGKQASREDQFRAHDALLTELGLRAGEKPSDWLAGSMVWIYEAGRLAPAKGDTGFSPAGKPAEERLARFWSARLTP